MSDCSSMCGYASPGPRRESLDPAVRLEGTTLDSMGEDDAIGDAVPQEALRRWTATPAAGWH
jgi:hypothetical protein